MAMSAAPSSLQAHGRQQCSTRGWLTLLIPTMSELTLHGGAALSTILAGLAVGLRVGGNEIARARIVAHHMRGAEL